MNSDQSEQPPGRRTEDFIGLYSAHHQRIYLYIVSLVISLDDAEELLSEVSLLLWKKFDDFEIGTNFYAWACQIVRNLVLQQVEKRGKAVLLLDGEVLEQLAEDAVAEEPDGDRRDALAACLQKCPPEDRQLVEQRYMAGVTVKSLAESLGRSPNALSKSLSRIRANLLACIERTLAARARECGGNP